MISLENLLSGNIRTIARAISLVENNRDGKEEFMDSIHKYTGRASIIGITGPPGAGKSTLADRLIQKECDEGKKVAVIAVDPSSPFTGGALLGDRLRMQKHATNKNVFIRSMASRGHLGGISTATSDAIKIFDAAGFDTVMVETIGVGQTEIEIMELSDLVMLVLVPGMGDEIQAMKAGVMEIGDIFVINKSDREGADRLKAEIEYSLMLGEKNSGDHPNVLQVSARDNTGIDTLHNTFLAIHKNNKNNGTLQVKRKTRIKKELSRLFTEKVKSFMEEELEFARNMDNWIEKIYTKQKEPYSLINEKIMELRGKYSK